nr:hypothetical protein [Corynebacterium sp. c6VSa_13]
MFTSALQKRALAVPRIRLLSATAAVACTAALALSPTAGAVPGAENLPEGPMLQPTAEQLNQVRDFAAQPWLPQQLRDTLNAAIAFYEGTAAPGDVELPENAPHVAQFYWPTVAGNCINGLNSVGTAIGVPGPSPIPAPGAGAEDTAFLFTALGTSAALPEQGHMKVNWINLDTMATGETQLNNYGVNPQGPATLSGTATTGRGTIIAVISGAVATQDATCNYAPTAGVIHHG